METPKTKGISYKFSVVLKIRKCGLSDREGILKTGGKYLEISIQGFFRNEILFKWGEEKFPIKKDLQPLP